MLETVTIPKEDWKELMTTVTTIKIALAGSKELNTTGIIQQQKDHETLLKEYVAERNRRKGMIIAWGSVCLFFSFAIPLLISWHFNTH